MSQGDPAGLLTEAAQVLAQHTPQGWQEPGLCMALPHRAWEHRSPHTALGQPSCQVFLRGTMHACRWMSMNTQGGMPVEEAVTQGWPISMGARGSLRLSSVMVVLRQPGSPTTVRTSCVCAPGSCAPLVGQGKPLPCLPHQLLPPSPVASLSACVTSGTPDRAHSSASHCRIVGPFL